jgi:tetratricopeptide (TPR) repeat protein
LHQIPIIHLFILDFKHSNYDQKNMYSYFYKKVLITIFIIVIFTPPIKTVFGLKHVISQTENRKLASIPELRMNLQSFQKFPFKFERYYKDHFGFRNKLVYLNSYFKANWVKVSPVPHVIIGKGNWLFWTGQGLIKDFRGLISLSTLQLETWKKNLEYKKNWLEKRSIRYLCVVAPDKQSIYPEYMPSYQNKVNKKTRFDQLLDYLKNKSDVKIIDLRPPLRGAKGNDLLYFQRDSHWNHKGAYIAYKSIMNQVLSWFPDEKMIDFHISDYEINSEIISMKSRGMESTLRLYLPKIPGWTLVSTPSFRFISPCAKKLELFKKAGNSGPFAKALEPFAKECPNSNLSAIVIRDSMFTEVEPFLSENFNSILYLWPLSRWKAYDNKYLKGYVEKIKPDIVIEEIGERMLFGGVSPDKFHFYNGTSYLRSGKIEEAVIQFNEALRLKPNYAKAHYNLGIALEKQNKSAKAMKHYIKAIQIKQNYAKAHNNLGCVLFSLDRIEEAITHFRIALKSKSNYSDAQINLKAALTASKKAGRTYCKRSKVDK